jgi:hypothetical protein
VRLTLPLTLPVSLNIFELLLLIHLSCNIFLTITTPKICLASKISLIAITSSI